MRIFPEYNSLFRGVLWPGSEGGTRPRLQRITVVGYCVAMLAGIAAMPATAQDSGQVFPGHNDQLYVEVDKTVRMIERELLQEQRQAERKRKQQERRAAREKQQAERAAQREKKQAERAAKLAAAKAQREAEQVKAEAEQGRRREEQLAAEAGIQKDCEQYKDWLADRSGIPYGVFLNQSPSARQKQDRPALAVPREAWAFEDSRARKLFGTTFDAVAEDGRKHWTTVGQRCGYARGDQSREFVAPLATLGTAFSSPERYNRIVEGLGQIRKSRARIEQLIDAFPELGPGRNDDEKFRQLAREAGDLESFTDDTLGMRFRNAKITGYHQTLDRTHSQNLLQAVREAKGYDGLAVLGRIQTDMSRDMTEYGLVATWPEEVRERQTEILQQLAGQEKAKIDNFDYGVDAIQQGTEWHKTFSSRLAAIRNVVPVQWTREINQHFDAKRNQTLRESEAAIVADIGKIENHEQLKSAILTSLPLEKDRSSDVGMEILAFAAAQQAAIDKALVLGVAVKQAIADANRSGKGPPTKGDIYDALMMEIAGYNQYAKSSVDKCNRAVRNNGSLNMLEVAPCFIIGAGQDKILQGNDIAAPQYRVSYFRQTGTCVQAANDNGWMCDYAYRLEGNVAMDVLNKLTGTGMQQRSRFVWDHGRWLRR